MGENTNRLRPKVTTRPTELTEVLTSVQHQQNICSGVKKLDSHSPTGRTDTHRN